MHVLEETADGLHLEGRTRLHAGEVIEFMAGPDAPLDGNRPGRHAYVLSWSVARLGKEGPTYRGRCRWQ